MSTLGKQENEFIDLNAGSLNTWVSVTSLKEEKKEEAQKHKIRIKGKLG